MEEFKSIAIDGPAGAGKSTVAKKIADKLGLLYVDTGAMYRAMALYMLEQHVPLEDNMEIAKAGAGADIGLTHEGGKQRVFLNGSDVTEQIRTENVSSAASKVSACREIRELLVKKQQEIAAKQGVVMDGRDIGTKVLPDAALKVFLTADAGERAKRRYEELKAKGEDCSLEKIEADIRERDKRDTEREASPLVQAEDAHLVDSSRLDADQVAEEILRLFNAL